MGYTKWDEIRIDESRLNELASLFFFFFSVGFVVTEGWASY